MSFKCIIATSYWLTVPWSWYSCYKSSWESRTGDEIAIACVSRRSGCCGFAFHASLPTKARHSTKFHTAGICSYDTRRWFPFCTLRHGLPRRRNRQKWERKDSLGSDLLYMLGCSEGQFLWSLWPLLHLLRLWNEVIIFYRWSLVLFFWVFMYAAGY